jgi:Domain of unknown function (DUF4148)
MKHTLLCSLFYPIATLATPAFAHDADTSPVTHRPAAQAGNGPRTRADIRAELIAAQRSGEYQAIREDASTYPQMRPYLKREVTMP